MHVKFSYDWHASVFLSAHVAPPVATTIDVRLQDLTVLTWSLISFF